MDKPFAGTQTARSESLKNVVSATRREIVVLSVRLLGERAGETVAAGAPGRQHAMMGVACARSLDQDSVSRFEWVMQLQIDDGNRGSDADDEETLRRFTASGDRGRRYDQIQRKTRASEGRSDQDPRKTEGSSRRR